MSLEHPQLELLTLLGLPFLGGVVVALLGPKRGPLIRWISLGVSLFCLLLALSLTVRFALLQPERAPELASLTTPTFRPVFVPGSTSVNPSATNWDLLNLGNGAVQFYIGVDGLNIWLILLTSVLFVPCVLVSWEHIDDRVNEFFAWLMALHTAMLGIFMAFDIVLFYVFFELSLVPLFFLIGIWGGPQRQHAARKFFIYTLTGSLLTLLGIIGIVLAGQDRTNQTLSFSIPRLVEQVHAGLADDTPGVRAYWLNVEWWIFLALTAGLAVKVPFFPLHTWLPLAHVEAPTAGSVDLAGVLLKVGAYGFLRLAVPLAPDVSLLLGLPLLSTLAAIGIVWGSLCALAQDDIKKMVAYSSVGHLGLCMLGLFALNQMGISGSLLMMINHGLTSAGLFLLVGMLYERYHTRKISDYSGMAQRLPLLGVFMVFICMAAAGLPGLNSFIGEVVILMGVFAQQLLRGHWPVYGLIGASGIFLGAWYLIAMLRSSFFGPVKEPHHEGHAIVDLKARELGAIVPIAALCLLIGIYPNLLIKTSEPDVAVVADIAQRARVRAGQPVPTPSRAEIDKRRE